MNNELVKNLHIKNKLNFFEDELLNIVKTKNLPLSNDLKDFLFAPSKRLRPLLIYIFSKILKIESPFVENIALSIELIHCASLLHDDILDNETIRRNNLPFYKLHGNKKAILMGDLLLSLALEELSKTNVQIIQVVSDKIQKTILGELSQNIEQNKILTSKAYYKKTFDKTGNLFLAGLIALTKIKKCNKKDYDALFDFTYNFSIAFQIKNDIDNIIKKDMSDIKNGNYTLPVIYFFMENSNYNLEKIKEIKKDDLKKYILKARNKVLEYKTKANKALQNIENSPYKDNLLRLLKKLF